MKKGQISKIGKIVLLLAIFIVILVAVILKFPTYAKSIRNMLDGQLPKGLSDACENKDLALTDQIKGCYDIGDYNLAVKKAEEFLNKNPNDESLDSAKLHNFVALSYIEIDTIKYGDKIMSNALRAKEISYKLNKVEGDEGGVEYKKSLEAILEYNYREFKRLESNPLKAETPINLFKSNFRDYQELFPGYTKTGEGSTVFYDTPYDRKRTEIVNYKP